ncbi:ornithine carbamoyltransferase [Desulfofundulus australicus DSM 11792]|jgi:ornithine carbamoyltransferase|uniref:Ornithine carbamoyltransferase n=1 Tax=Desulfofundulus australicus DSM 11792 TaxID=1121425 RepID=A0A1M4X5V7_9FIRM|nr:ornithine carbamoyltransferase [Desulfofundulus australicus]MDK2887776.1 ornithine carbamoyltransferase [Thermoanaerobacter sp.]SHE88841.1 ornithine carbamoyltransferase [Desulfofundulus australicus DSM 11792]
MKENFKGRDLLSLHDFTPDEIITILDLADELKSKQKRGIPHPYLTGKTLGMIFQKSSTRTRVSFEVAMYQLGGYALYLNAGDLQLGRGESIADTARVLSRYLDGIMIRTYAQADVEELARYADIPVINGLTDLLHPCQVLADLQTIREYKGRLAGLKLAYVGDGNNVCHSLLFGCAKTGINISVASPPGYQPREEIVRAAREDAISTGSRIEILTDPVAAVTGADVVVTDVWASMGQEQESELRKKVFAPYQVNGELVRHASPDFIFLHCLPAHRGEEVTAEIIDGPHSAVWDEAENRLHAQKAVLALLMA